MDFDGNRQGKVDVEPAVHVYIYPFGSSKSAASPIVSRFKSELEVDDWIQAFKNQLDEVAESAKRALRVSRARGALP